MEFITPPQANRPKLSKKPFKILKSKSKPKQQVASDKISIYYYKDLFFILPPFANLGFSIFILELYPAEISSIFKKAFQIQFYSKRMRRKKSHTFINELQLWRFARVYK